jgi:hypothetical protein
VSRAPENDPRVVALIDAFDDELIQQRRGAAAFASGT